MLWDTAGNVLNDAAVELGLVPADLESPYSSTDPAILQLRRLLKSVGQRLVRAHAWSQLVKPVVVTTEPGTASYPLPEDFARPVDQTSWNRSARLPMAGPVGAQGWQMLQAISSSPAANTLYRLVGNQLVLYPAPATIADIAFEYVSTWWVQQDLETPTRDAPDGGADILWFDRQLLLAGVKLAFLSAKGFDTTAAEEEYDEAFAAARGADAAGPSLHLNGPAGPHLLDWHNVPEGGWGG